MIEDTGTPAELKGRLRDVIGRGAAAPFAGDGFDDLALAVFAHQFDTNPIYRGYCERRGVTPASAHGWLDIPAVPTDAFKAAPLLSGGDPAAAEATFRTSGTTAGAANRGTHHMLRTDLYRAALREGARAALLPDRRQIRIISLAPGREELPDSSLSFMIDEIVEAFGAEGSASFVSQSAGQRTEALLAAVEDAIRDGVPALIAGASFAFVHFLDSLDARGIVFRLPPGSRVMDTGGFKGRSREVDRSDLYAMIGDRLGIDPAFIVNEYGMTEMSSQFYDGVAGSAPSLGATRVHRGPGWVRSVAVDPESLHPVPNGESGILRHVDLANLYSVAAIQTSDFGVVRPDGGIELRGRAAGAEARGCSIAVDELLEVMARRGSSSATPT